MLPQNSFEKVVGEKRQMDSDEGPLTKRTRAHPLRLGPVTETCLERAIVALRRSKIPASERGWYYISFAKRVGITPLSAHISALNMPPANAVEVAEAAGIRMTLRELAGDVTPKESTMSCPKRAAILSIPQFYLQHCGKVTPNEVFDVFHDGAPSFFKQVGMRISYDEYINRITRPYLLAVHAKVVRDLTIETLRNHCVQTMRVPEHMATILHESGLGVSIESLTYICGFLRPDETATYVIRFGLQANLRDAADSGWSPRDLWTVVRRDAALPETAEFFASPIPESWSPQQRAKWFKYRRSVRVLQNAFRIVKKKKAARKIQAMWKRVSSDPSRGPCKRRLHRLFSTI
jgi:hypothetical protein